MAGVQVVVQEIVEGDDVVENIFVDDFEGAHAYQRLLVAVVEVDGDVAVIDTGHIGIEDAGGKPGIFLFSRQPVEESGVTGDTHDFAVQALYVPSGLGGVYAFHRTSG